MMRTHILLVEDNAGDRDLVREGLALKPHQELYCVTNGEEAMSFLKQQGEYSTRPRPGLILLDLNLPRKDGREVLAEIKTDKELNTIPVVVFTSSKAERDIAESYSLGANCYIAKPMDLQEYRRVLQSIQSFWLSDVELPDRG